MRKINLEKVFCNVPWYEIHINADGTYHTCGAQPNRISGTPDADIFNINNMSIEEYVNHPKTCAVRLAKMAGVPEPLCERCYYEEDNNNYSKRQRELLKSVIFTGDNFHKSFNQSPIAKHIAYTKDNNGQTNIIPISYHVSLGNECNSACKMCEVISSSKFAAELKAKGMYNGPVRINWTDNNMAWNSFLNTVKSTKNIKALHIIGGEPFIMPKFIELVDWLINNNITDIYLGVTTNGTVFNKYLLDQLSKFTHLDLGISIEAVSKLNDDIRISNVKIDKVLENILKIKEYRSDGFYITLRTVPSLLSVGEYDKMLDYSLSIDIPIMSNMLTHPEYLRIENLPIETKKHLCEKFNQWLHNFELKYNIKATDIFNDRDPNQILHTSRKEMVSIINSLRV